MSASSTLDLEPAHSLGSLLGGRCHLAIVVSVKDPEGLSRVQVRLVGFDGVDQHDGPIWARVVAPFAGKARGAFFLPDVDDEVLVSFAGGDPRLAVILGGFWNGSAPAPETLGGDGDSVDRWTIVGKAGTRIAIVEEASGSPKISLTTPGGVSGEWTDEGGGKITLSAAGSTLTIDATGIALKTSGKFTIEASSSKVTSLQIDLDALMVICSSFVKCDTLLASNVVSQTYTPGEGNIW